MNKKADRIKFVNSTKEQLLGMGAKQLPNNSIFMVFRIEGKNNSITFQLENEEHHKECYSLFAKFDKMNALTGYCNHKHNFHSFIPHCPPYLSEIEQYLT